MSEDQVNESAESATTDDLEAEGDLAADYIEGLLDLADLDGDLDISVASGRAYLSVTGGGEDLDRLAMPETGASTAGAHSHLRSESDRSILKADS